MPISKKKIEIGISDEYLMPGHDIEWAVNPGGSRWIFTKFEFYRDKKLAPFIKANGKTKLELGLELIHYMQLLGDAVSELNPQDDFQKSKQIEALKGYLNYQKAIIEDLWQNEKSLSKDQQEFLQKLHDDIEKKLKNTSNVSAPSLVVPKKMRVREEFLPSEIRNIRNHNDLNSFIQTKMPDPSFPAPPQPQPVVAQQQNVPRPNPIQPQEIAANPKPLPPQQNGSSVPNSPVSPLYKPNELEELLQSPSVTKLAIGTDGSVVFSRKNRQGQLVFGLMTVDAQGKPNKYNPLHLNEGILYTYTKPNAQGRAQGKPIGVLFNRGDKHEFYNIQFLHSQIVERGNVWAKEVRQCLGGAVAFNSTPNTPKNKLAYGLCHLDFACQYLMTDEEKRSAIGSLQQIASQNQQMAKHIKFLLADPNFSSVHSLIKREYPDLYDEKIVKVRNEQERLKGRFDPENRPNDAYLNKLASQSQKVMELQKELLAYRSGASWSAQEEQNMRENLIGAFNQLRNTLKEQPNYPYLKYLSLRYDAYLASTLVDKALQSSKNQQDRNQLHQIGREAKELLRYTDDPESISRRKVDTAHNHVQKFIANQNTHAAPIAKELSHLVLNEPEQVNRKMLELKEGFLRRNTHPPRDDYLKKLAQKMVALDALNKRLKDAQGHTKHARRNECIEAIKQIQTMLKESDAGYAKRLSIKSDAALMLLHLDKKIDQFESPNLLRPPLSDELKRLQELKEDCLKLQEYINNNSSISSRDHLGQQQKDIYDKVRIAAGLGTPFDPYAQNQGTPRIPVRNQRM